MGPDLRPPGTHREGSRGARRKFLDQADGDPVRAAHRRSAYYARLALKSAQSRRKARELTEVAEIAEAELNEVGDLDAAS